MINVELFKQLFESPSNEILTTCMEDVMNEFQSIRQGRQTTNAHNEDGVDTKYIILEEIFSEQIIPVISAQLPHNKTSLERIQRIIDMATEKANELNSEIEGCIDMVDDKDLANFNEKVLPRLRLREDVFSLFADLTKKKLHRLQDPGSPLKNLADEMEKKEQDSASPLTRLFRR